MKELDVRKVALVAVMAAVACVMTLIVQIPVPGTKEFIHLGDIAANFAALAFGPWLGFLIAGGGMAIADLIGGWGIYAPGTLIIHGLQAVVVAFLGRSRTPWAMFLAAIAGGAVVVSGYFVYVWLILREGLGPALIGAGFNTLQIVVGLIGVPVYMLVARAYPPLSRWARKD